MRRPTQFWLEGLKGKSPLGRPRRGWEDNVNTNLREARWEGIHWIHLAQDGGR
jgi:hypothetical protein